MAEAIQVPKLAKVCLGGSLSSVLGYTRNGCEIEPTHYRIPVNGDEHGGDDGPEIDFQLLPPVYIVRLSLTKFDKTLFEEIESSVKSGTAGTFAATDIGTLAIANTKYWRVTIQTANTAWIRNFPIAIPIDAQPYNLGTRFMEAAIVFRAMRNISTGVTMDQTAAT